MKWKGTVNRRMAWLLLAALAVGNTGCLLVAAGAGVAGGAAGYAYYQGRVARTYLANLEDTWSATVTALGELGMPVVSSERIGNTGTIVSRTADGDRVNITLDLETSRIPAEGKVTRVCIRVAVFGDHPVSNRILDQIGFHLVPGQRPPPEPPVVTTEPPLAGPPPGEAAKWSSPPPAPPEPARKAAPPLAK
jgi:hypothetical protein